MDFKQELAKKADTKQKPKEVMLTKNRSIFILSVICGKIAWNYIDKM